METCLFWVHWNACDKIHRHPVEAIVSTILEPQRLDQRLHLCSISDDKLCRSRVSFEELGEDPPYLFRVRLVEHDARAQELPRIFPQELLDEHVGRERSQVWHVGHL
jgi:hypothetical protein